jgi:hypothetical protein
MISRALTATILALGIAILITLGVVFKVPLSTEQAAFFLMGSATAGLFGFIWFRLNDWISAATSPGRPQSIRLNTDDTPAQITWAAIRATLTLVLICLILLVVFAGLMSNVLGIDLLSALSTIS